MRHRPSYVRERPTTSRKTLGIIIIGGAAAASLSGCIATDQTSAIQSSRGSALPAAPTTTPTHDAVPPVPADFVDGVIVTEQKCFGSAGCNYKYTINPQCISAKPVPDKTTVVFKVTGGDQDQIGNFTIDSTGTATFDRETRISGPEGADLLAAVTQVIPGR